jgi:hypothetical protein
MWMFIWVLHIISHIGLNMSSTIANFFCKFQVMLLFSSMSWMSITNNMTFISMSEMQTVSSIKKYNLPIRGLWIHTTSNVCTLSLTKRMTWHLTCLCPTKPWRMFTSRWPNTTFYARLVQVSKQTNTETCHVWMAIRCWFWPIENYASQNTSLKTWTSTPTTYQNISSFKGWPNTRFNA